MAHSNEGLFIAHIMCGPGELRAADVFLMVGCGLRITPALGMVRVSWQREKRNDGL